MWPQSDALTHNFCFLQTGQQVVAALPDGHAVVLAPLSVVAIVLPAAAQGDCLEAGQHIGIVVAIESRLDPRRTHLQHLPAKGHQLLIVAQLLGAHSGAVEQHIKLLWYIEEVAHMLTHHLTTVCKEPVDKHNRISMENTASYSHSLFGGVGQEKATLCQAGGKEGAILPAALAQLQLLFCGASVDGQQLLYKMILQRRKEIPSLNCC